MVWPVRALLTVLSLASATPLAAYPTPVDFGGRLLAWPLHADSPSLHFELEADREEDFTDFSPVVEEAARLWSEVEGSYLRLEPASEAQEAEVTIHLKRAIEDAAYSSGYTEFDELTDKGMPVHCSIYIHADPTFSYQSIAKTILHELGHCLGLGHSLIPEAIMSYRLTRNTFQLDIDDKAAVSRLYPSDTHKPRLPPGCAIGSPRYEASGASRNLTTALLLLPALYGVLCVLRRARLIPGASGQGAKPPAKKD